MSDQIKTVYLKPIYSKASNFSTVMTVVFKPIDDKGAELLTGIQKAMGDYKEPVSGKDFNKKSFDEKTIKFSLANIPSINYVCSEETPKLKSYNQDEVIKFNDKINIDLSNIANILD